MNGNEERARHDYEEEVRAAFPIGARVVVRNGGSNFDGYEGRVVDAATRYGMLGVVLDRRGPGDPMVVTGTMAFDPDELEVLP